MIICILGYLLNVIDALMTYHYINAGLAEELNPLVAFLIENDIMLSIKTLWCAVFFFFIERCIHHPYDESVRKVAKYGAIFITSAYGLLVTYEIICSFIVGW